MPDAPKVLLGVTGSIAAYKAVELMRLMQKKGWDVWPVMTACATQYVGPLTFAALSGHPVPTGDFATARAADYEHLALSENAAAMIIAPCSANTMAKLAGGFAGDVLSATALSLEAPLLVAPAMNTRMWNHAATQDNLAVLKRRGVRIIPPETGELGCGEIGTGRLATLDALMNALETVLTPR